MFYNFLQSREKDEQAILAVWGQLQFKAYIPTLNQITPSTYSTADPKLKRLRLYSHYNR